MDETSNDSKKEEVKSAAPSTMDVKTPKSGNALPTDDWSDVPAPSPEVKVDGDGKLTGAPAAEDTSITPPVNPAQLTKKKNNGLVIIVAVVIFLLLAVAAYFAYQNNQETITSKATSTTETVSPATTADVDQANTDSDKDLSSVNDDTDFASSDLSDASLDL